MILEYLTAGVCICAIVLYGYLRLGWREAADVARALPPPDVRAVERESLESYLAVRRRAWTALGQSLVIALPAAEGILLVGGSIFAALAWRPLSGFELDAGWLFSLSGLARMILFLVTSLLIASVLVALVAQFRLIQRIREGCILTWRAVAIEFDAALGTAGIFPTLLLSLLLLALAGLWFGFWIEAGRALAGLFDHGMSWAIASGAGSGAAPFGVATRQGAPGASGLSAAPAGAYSGAGAWIGFVVAAAGATPALFAILGACGVLAMRDPGWLSGFEAGIGFARFRPAIALRLCLCIAGRATSISRWPAALWLVLGVFENQMHLVSVLLRERRARDVMKDIEQLGLATEGALAEAGRLLEAGRFLDALNAYQMHYYKNPMSERALEGVARAQLCIGNPLRARQAVEKILILNPQNPVALRIKTEMEQGLWDENGALRRDAAARCRQPLGKGIENRDVIDPEVRKMFETSNSVPPPPGTSQPPS